VCAAARCRRPCSNWNCSAPKAAGTSGAIERADGGTLLLDEADQMPPSVQVRVLRLLQDRVTERVRRLARASRGRAPARLV
jgi:transcriptional regulator with AAA-type ATPase domain